MSLQNFLQHKNKVQKVLPQPNDNGSMSIKYKEKDDSARHLPFYKTHLFALKSKYILSMTKVSYKTETFPLGTDSSLKQAFRNLIALKNSQFFVAYVLKRVLREWFLRIVVSVKRFIYIETESEKEKRTNTLYTEKEEKSLGLLLKSLEKSYKVYLTTVTAIRPLLKNLVNQRMDDETVMTMKNILCNAINSPEKLSMTLDSDYIRLAVGPKEWPLGVLMTDIHSRAGREKIQSNNIKSWLTNDISRGYLHAFRRISELIVNFDILKF